MKQNPNTISKTRSGVLSHLEIFLASLAMVALAAFSGCGKKNETPEAQTRPSKADISKAIPAIEMIASDVDAALVINRPAALLDKALASPFIKDFLNLPFIQPEAEKAGYHGDPAAWLNEALDRNPKNRHRYDLFRDLLGEEVFLVMPKGTAEQVDVFLSLYEEIQALQILAEFHPLIAQAQESVSASPDSHAADNPGDASNHSTAPSPEKPNHLIGMYLSRLKPLLERIQVPSLLIGVKSGAKGEEYLDRRIVALEQQIPAAVVRGEMEFAGVKLKTVQAPFRDLLPKELIEVAREDLFKKIGDSPDAAGIEDLWEKALSKGVKIVHGRLAGRYVVAIGPLDEAGKIPGLAADASSSLIQLKGIEFVEEHARKDVFLFSYASVELAKASRRPLGLTKFAESLKTFLPNSVMSVEQAERLVTDARRLDASYDEIANGKVTPSFCIAFIESGLRIESRGGLTWPILACGGNDVGRFLRGDGAPFYYGYHFDDAINAKTYAFIEDLCSTAYNTLKNFALPRMSQADQQNFSVAESLFVPKLASLWGIIKDLNLKALGPQGGLIIDLAEPVPSGDQVPVALRGKGRVPNIALFSTIRDEKMLGEVWERLYNWANEVTMLLPPLPQIVRPLPKPEVRQKDGATSYFYAIKEFLGGDGLGVTIRDGVWFLGTSINAQERHSVSLHPKPEGLASFVIDFQSKPVVDAAREWADLLFENPDAANQAGMGGAAPSETELRMLRSALDFASRFKNAGFFQDQSLETPRQGFWIELSKP